MKNKKFQLSKETPEAAGVYMIRNATENKMYIGSAKNIKRRLISHESALRNNRHFIHEMQDDYNKGDFFYSDILCEIKEELDLLMYERIACNIFMEVSTLYNRVIPSSPGVAESKMRPLYYHLKAMNRQDNWRGMNGDIQRIRRENVGVISYNKLWEMLGRKNIDMQFLYDNGLCKNTVKALKENRYASASILKKLCFLLKCQPGDILEYIPPETP